MAELIDVIDIDLSQVQEEAEETQKTLKDLRQEVKDLRTQLENTAIGSEEFGDTLSELTRKQQELTNVTKSGIAAQKGSYNDLVNQMAILKAQWRSTADEAERAALGEQINDINNQLKQLDGTIGNHQRNVGNYKGELKALKEQMMSLEEGTEEYAAACARAAEISQKMQDVNEFVAQSAQDLGDQLGNVVGVAGGMVGAFQTVQATLNLVGVESESVGKALQTMQNLMAITQGLTAIEGAIDKYKRLNEALKSVNIIQKIFGTQSKANAVATAADAAASTADATAKGAQATATTAATTAQWSLNAAIAANPLGALITVIVAAVTAIVSLVSWLGTAGDSAESLKAKNEELTDSYNRQNDAIAYNIQMLEAQGRSRSEALKSSLADYKRQYEQAYEDYLDMWNEANGTERWLGLAKSISDDEQEQLDAAYQRYTDQVKLYNDTVKAYNLERTREETNKRKEQQDAEKRAYDESVRNARNAAQERLRIIAEEKQKIAKLRKEYMDEYNDLVDIINKNTMDERQYSVLKLQEEYENKRLEAQRIFNEERLALNELVKQKEIKTQEEYDAEYAKILEKKQQWEKTAREAFRIEMKGLEAQWYQSELDMVKSFTDEQTKLYEEARKRNMRSFILMEETAKTQFDNIPVGLSLRAKVEAEENMLKSLRAAYEGQKAALEAQDEKEREMLETQIKIFEERQESIGLLDTEEQLLWKLRDQYNAIGSEAALVGEKLNEVNIQIAGIDTEKTVATLEATKQTLETLRSTFAELNNIGGAFSNEWTTAFDSMLSGIDLTIESLRNMNSVLDSNASKTEKAAAKWQGYGNMASAALGAASSILSALADEQDEASKEGFETQKKLQIAAATMSMLQGIASAWASAMQLGPIAGPIMGGVLTAMTATLGGIQIAKIQQQQFGGSGNSGAGGSSNSVPDITPAFTAVQAMGQGVNSVTTVEGASADGNIKDTKVYVSETDISSTQHRVNVMESEAMY